MPTRNVNLTATLDKFVTAKVASGRYENASEVVRAGLRVLEQEERRNEAKLTALKVALAKGERSGFAEDDTLQGVLIELRRRRKR
jgi:antitoxin ParD1/3/4